MMLDTFRHQISPPTREPSGAFLARCYGITKQNLHKLCKKHDIKPETFTSPSCIFLILSEGYQSSLVKRLADPAEQARIQAKILSFYELESTERLSKLRQSAAITR